ncbi:helix-turn-helix domain-containing protein [Clostridium estertheticum]|uniref:helix-turn-helix domain-containing protein n=1 Tax=Clostridium estertheticum TaxID=238834 RepID=UPI001C0DC776|nr:helix-turn-helix domain-containing protein [Clostridium estertheticum]MBU3075596.1 helix-turn-helix domain-containing protein [Clostridium estertheticum]MBU3164822.1 helix-turn-helix domain-containing protein [Clostridium estertheticum]
MELEVAVSKIDKYVKYNNGGAANMLTNLQKQKVRNSFESILRADYVSISDLSQMDQLDEYYVDFFNNTGSLLQRQDNYISGRRGTGKTALLLKGYYECLKTISRKVQKNSEILGDDKVLPVYIDLSNCKEMLNQYSGSNLLEINFVRQIILNLKAQLNLIFEEKFLSKFIENPSLEGLDYIEKVLIEGITVSNRAIKVEEKVSVSDISGIKLGVSSVGPSAEVNCSTSESIESTIKHREVKSLDVQSFLDKIDKIRKKAKIDYIYIFVDEFSDLNEEEQIIASKLIKKFLGSKINMFFKIGVISERYNFGDNIIIGRDLFQIPLDLKDYVERYGGIVNGVKQLEAFAERLIEARISNYCPDLEYNDIFKAKKKDINFRLARTAMGVPRTIGLILQNAWLRSETNGSGDQKIGLTELNYGIIATKKMYFLQFQGSIKKRLLPGFNMDMWDSILNKAISEKSKYPERPASHFLVDPIRKDYMNILCENFIIHHLEDSRSSKYGGNYGLYSIDYGICVENNIKYAEEKDEFTAFRFVYDNVLSEYDPYFINEKLKSYRCPVCEKIYDEKDVCHINVKRCFTDDSLLEEIIHKDSPTTKGNYAEVEIKVLGLISSLGIDEAMSAQEIADAVGCSRQKVSAWGSRVLYKDGLINIEIKNDKNNYYSAE